MIIFCPWLKKNCTNYFPIRLLKRLDSSSMHLKRFCTRFASMSIYQHIPHARLTKRFNNYRQLCTECSKSFPQILIALDRLTKSQASGELDTLRAMKNTINDFNSQVEGIRQVLMELLDNDESLRLLHLSDVKC